MKNLLCLILLLLTGCFNPTQIELEGRKAAQLGIPADANPYVRSPDIAPIWLRGYMGYLQEHKQAEQQ